MKRTTVPPVNISLVEKLPQIDFIDNDFAIFDDISDIPIYGYPSRLDSAVLALCQDGWARIGVNLKEYGVRKHTLVVLMPDQIIQGYHVSEDFSGLFIAVSKNYIENNVFKFQDMLSFFLYIKDHPCTEVTAEEANCLKEYHAFLWRKVKMVDNPYRKEITLGLLQSFFYDICNIFRHHMPREESGLSRKEQIFTDFIHTVAIYFREKRSVAFYAAKLCITPKHLTSVVKDVSGNSAGEWIDNYVILAAKALLKSTAKTVLEISLELNFANQSFFGKYFKQHTGISPKEYRKN